MTFATKVYKTDNGDTQIFLSGGKGEMRSGATLDMKPGSTLYNDTVVRNLRMRVTTAEANAGKTLLAAIAGYKYRMVDCTMIAIGGSAGTVTTMDILGTQTSEIKLVAFAQAQLTRSTVLKPGITGAAVLADGQSFLSNDANTAIRVLKTGTAMDTATHLDIILDYVIEAA